MKLEQRVSGQPWFIPPLLPLSLILLPPLMFAVFANEGTVRPEPWGLLSCSTCGGLDWLSEHLDVGELVCLLLSLRFLPDSAICWSKSPSAFDFCIVKRKKMSLSLWYCTHVTDCKTDTGFAKFAEAVRVLVKDKANKP